MENLQLLDVKNDYLFKRIFGEDEEIFIDFANSILNYPEERKIKSVTFLNNEVNKDSEFDKESRFDVIAQLNDGSFVNLEMQMRNTGEYEKRCLYYWAKLYEKQLGKGEPYRVLSPSICIHVLNFNFFKEKEEFMVRQDKCVRTSECESHPRKD
ncbi:Rpn family recombination-promoting nuclease/putative transposase [Silvanigrella sp.]|uniref:Rpn family recombination-promoting nuclease/putative transposase n=1 Tax=Silvanigrella sp. TaxID=2024976 RepID=UPI0037CCA5F5